MTMENDLVERRAAEECPKTMPANWPSVLESRARAGYVNDSEGSRLLMFQTATLIRTKDDRIQALEAELAAALIEVSNQAQLRGEAEGKLHVSELAGIVEGWQLRAERAEAERDEALERAERWKDTAGAEAEAFEEQKAQTKRAEAELATTHLAYQAENKGSILRANAAVTRADRAEAELARKTEALGKACTALSRISSIDTRVGYRGLETVPSIVEFGPAAEYAQSTLNDLEDIAARSALEEKTNV